MTPASRDRNLGRVRGLTGAAVGIAFAACGLFAGLAASATKHVFSAAPTTTTGVKRTLQAQTTTAATTTTTAASSSALSVASSAPVQTQQAPVASSGGS